MNSQARLLLTILSAALLLILFSPGEANAGKKKVAVLQFRANNITNAYADAVRDILEVHLFRTDIFEIVERNRIDVILKEQGLEETGCIDTGCAVKIGKLLSVDWVVVGSISKIKQYTITIKIIDVTEGTVVYADSEAEVAEDKIEERINTLSLRIAEKIKPGSNPQSVNDSKDKSKVKDSKDVSYVPADYYFRGIIPGWAQFYSGRTYKGYAFLGSFVLTGAFAIWGYWNYNAKKNFYVNASVSSRKDFDKKFKEYEDATLIGRISLGIFVLAYAANWIDVIFFSKPIKENPAAFYESGNNYLSFDIKQESCLYNDKKYEVRFGVKF